MGSSFDIAVALTLRNEGGLQLIPTDRGNWTSGKIGVGELRGTKFGISAHEFPLTNIAALTEEDASTIYRTKYWDPMYCEINDQLVCNKIFDMSVLWGRSKAVEVMQDVLKTQFHLIPDGVFGMLTLMAINKSEPHSLLIAYQTAFTAHAIQIGKSNPNEAPFVNDYIRRINS